LFQELERQKKLLKQGQSSGPSGGGVNELGPGVGGGPPLAGRPANSGTAEMHLLSANQRAALDMASKTSFGFFITQGINVILDNYNIKYFKVSTSK